MRTVLLTTDTTHHTWFAWKLHERFPLQAIFLETKGLRASFETAHPFETRRDAYEREVLLAGFRSELSAIAPAQSFESMNDPAALAALRTLRPDVVLVFGTGRLGAAVIKTAASACLNLHGGNPEEYRGLDTHLWAVYHADFENLVTTLHHVDDELDTGDLVFQGGLEVPRGCRMHELRAINAKVCLELSSLALGAIEARGAAPRRTQLRRGRYYSFMPAALKDLCVRRFERWAASR